MAQKKRLVVLISGSGSNLQAIIDATQSGQINAEIAAVVSNKPGVKGLQRAQQAGIKTLVIESQKGESREAYDQKVLSSVEPLLPDLLILAGFMRILSESFVKYFEGRMLNIHPSLLPAYKGLHTHQRALDDKKHQHGASVHFVTYELDGGPVVLQARVPILADDNADSLAARVLTQEHIIYPQVVQWFCEDRLSYRDGKVIFDNQELQKPLFVDKL